MELIKKIYYYDKIILFCTKSKYTESFYFEVISGLFDKNKKKI